MAEIEPGKLPKTHPPFKFRKGKQPTGLYSVGHPYPDTYITFEGHEVGCISAPSWETADSTWALRFRVRDERDCAGWRWVQFKMRGESEPVARKMALRLQPAIMARYFFWMDPKGANDMARKMTKEQERVLDAIRRGYVVTKALQIDRTTPPLYVMSWQHAMTGDTVECHRTVDLGAYGRGTPTQLFRIKPDGTITQH